MSTLPITISDATLITTREDGRREFVARCRVPFEAPVPTGWALRADPPSGTVAPAATRQEPMDGEPEMDPEEPTGPHAEGGVAYLEGIASSTSVDSYGTEMSRECLEDMAQQMRGTGVYDRTGGVSYVPTHRDNEWDQEIGQTVDGTVERATVLDPAVAAEVQYALRAIVALDLAHPRARALQARLAKGKPVGQSIGGWFLEVRFITSADGDVERIIVEKVDLDHLAATRRPSNPDSWVAGLRTALRDRAAALVTRSDALPVPVAKVEAERGATGASDLPLAPEDTPWVWGAAEQDAVLGDPPDWPRYRKAHFWYDPENAEVKSGYKLAFARFVDGELRAVLRAVAAVMSILNGGRGGADISDSDREAVYRRVAAYYERFGKEAPELAPRSESDPPDADPALDSQPAAGHDSPEARSVSNDAASSGEPDQVPSARTADPVHDSPPAPEDATMPDITEIRAALAEELAPLKERLAAVEAKPATTDEPTGQRRQVRAKMPEPRLIQTGGQRARAQVDSLIAAVEREGDAPELLATLSKAPGQAIDMLSAPPRDRSISIGEAQQAIKDVCEAAERDGIIDWDQPYGERTLNVSTAAGLMQVAIQKAVQQVSDRTLGVISTLPVVPGSGDAYYVNQRTPNTTGAEWLADGSDPTDYTGNVTQVSFPYKILSTRGKVTRFLQARGRSYGDVLGGEMTAKADDFAEVKERAAVVGTGASNQPSGLLKLTGAGQTVAMSAGVTADLTLAKLDETIAKVKGRANKSALRIYCSAKGHQRLNALLQAQQRFNDTTVIEAGFTVQTYQDIPVIETTEMPDTLVFNGTAITAYSGGGSTAFIVANTQYVKIAQLTPTTVVPLAKASSAYDQFDMVEDLAFVVENPKGIAVLAGVEPDA